jgi:squalene cyclase
MHIPSIVALCCCAIDLFTPTPPKVEEALAALERCRQHQTKRDMVSRKVRSRLVSLEYEERTAFIHSFVRSFIHSVVSLLVIGLNDDLATFGRTD